MSDRFVEPRKNREEEQKLIDAFLNKGGEIVELRTYSKGAAKADKKEKTGSIMVFDREERLRKK
jgi:hypothetical protein